MKEVNTILEMLIESRTQLIEAKARLKEREAEIDKDLRDCEIAIAALTPKAEVAAEQPQEQTPEDQSNLHSYLHVSGGAEKPYRIKTRQEMIDGGAVLCSEYKGHKRCIKHPDGMHLFTNEMTVLFGSETETNEPHDIIIDGIPYAIEPWMITENN